MTKVVRSILGLIGGGAAGYGYHAFLVRSATYCTNCDQSLTPVAIGAAVGLALMALSKNG